MLPLDYAGTDKVLFIKPLIWWQLGNLSPDIMQSCETMSKLVCRSSKLKSDSYLYRNNDDNHPHCDMCQDFALEDAEHLVIHCSFS